MTTYALDLQEYCAEITWDSSSYIDAKPAIGFFEAAFNDLLFVVASRWDTNEAHKRWSAWFTGVVSQPATVRNHPNLFNPLN